MNEYKSNAAAIVHSTMQELQEIELVSKTTLKEYDELCLKPVAEIFSDESREIKEKK